jgi:hypothetical protein
MIQDSRCEPAPSLRTLLCFGCVALVLLRSSVVGSASNTPSPAVAAADLAGMPAGAQAYYDLATTAGGIIPNGIQATGALPALSLRGTDYRVTSTGTVWNENIGAFTFKFPFDPSRGTYAETASGFPNAYPTGGTLAVRLRVDPSVLTNLGQASSMGLITFRPNPEINVHRVPPRSVELKREGPTDPLQFLVREGANSIGYNNEFNDEVRSLPLTNMSADKIAIVVWQPSTLQIFVDGVRHNTRTRVTADNPATSYRLQVAVQSSLIHSGDNQFYKGTIRSVALYNRPLSDTEVTALFTALNSGGSTVPAPGPPTNVRIVR